MSSNSTNKTNVPEAKEAMNRFKMEVANELGVPLRDVYKRQDTHNEAADNPLHQADFVPFSHKFSHVSHHSLFIS